MTGNDVTWPHVTESESFYRKSPGSGCRRPKTRVLCNFEILQGCNSQEVAVMSQEMMSRDLAWPDVTRKWCHFAASHLEVAVECHKRVLGKFELLQGCNSQEVGVMWQKMMYVTSRDWKWPGNDIIWPEVICKSLWEDYKSSLGTFDYLQGCNSQEVGVTWKEMTSRDLAWPEVTWKWRHLTGSHLEMAVGGL